MGNSNSKEQEYTEALNRAIDSFNGQPLVQLNRWFSDSEKIGHVSSAKSQDMLTMRDMGFLTGGLGGGAFAMSFNNTQTNNYTIELHNHGSGNQSFNLFQSL